MVMIVSKKYVCEFCSSSYYYEEDALKCESGHRKINRIVSNKYYSRESKAPNTIVVELDDEEKTRVRYRIDD